jgi:hypothetical protein
MKLLAISGAAPPQLSAQAIQVARLLYHLDADVTLLHRRDRLLADRFDQYPDFFHRVAAHVLADPPTTGPCRRAAVRALALCGARLPDAWSGAALPVALERIRAARPDVLASFGPGMSDHLLALALKRHTGLPWLAHMSEPGQCVGASAAHERRVLAHADQLLFPSAHALARVMARHPPAWRVRAAVLPYAWDQGNFSSPLTGPAPADAHGRYVVRFLGACTGARSAQPLVAALARIAATRPRHLDHVRFELIGPVASSAHDAGARKALPAGLLTVRGAVGYRASLQLARDAAALLVIDGPGAGLPSNLIDYIGARRPVWGITPPGPGADLIAEWAGGAHTCADPGEPASVAAMLAGAVDGLDCQARLYGSDRVALRFAPFTVARGFQRYLRQAMGRRATI